VRQKLKGMRLLFLGATFCSLGCVVTREESIIGTYLARTPCSTTTLTVNIDHTFVQSVRTLSGQVNEIDGKWTLDATTGWMDFKPFLDFSQTALGRRGHGFLARVEHLPKGLTMGPMDVACLDSLHEADYVK
jgi:hypothetical protein